MVSARVEARFRDALLAAGSAGLSAMCTGVQLKKPIKLNEMRLAMTGAEIVEKLESERQNRHKFITWWRIENDHRL